MNEQRLPHLIPKVCPICGQDYLTRYDIDAPTCGHPKCIKKAQAQGKPFAVPGGTPTLPAYKHQKRAHGINGKK